MDEGCEKERSSPNKDARSSSVSVGFLFEATFEVKEPGGEWE